MKLIQSSWPGADILMMQLINWQIWTEFRTTDWITLFSSRTLWGEKQTFSQKLRWINEQAHSVYSQRRKQEEWRYELKQQESQLSRCKMGLCPLCFCHFMTLIYIYCVFRFKRWEFLVKKSSLCTFNTGSALAAPSDVVLFTFKQTLSQRSLAMT